MNEGCSPRELVRNIGIIAHVDAGKTTFSERVLYYSDVIRFLGEVHDGTAAMDFMPEEQERGITIASACTTCLWGDYTINLIDTPGHVDFTIEVERALRVLDGAVGVFCGIAGVEPQSEKVWRQADAHGLPRIAVINKLDRDGASYAYAFSTLESRLGVTPLPLTVPAGEGECFFGVLDLLRCQKIVFDPATLGRVIKMLPFSDEDAEIAAPWLEKMFDVLSAYDDKVLEAYCSGKKIPENQLEKIIRLGVLNSAFVPVFAIAALKNIGVQPVLDAVCRYLPSPLDIKPVYLFSPCSGGGEAGCVQVKISTESPLCALVFKVMLSGGQKVVFLRLYSGTLQEGDTPYNLTQGRQETVSGIFRMHADDKEQVFLACAGDVVAVTGCAYAQTGDTFGWEGQKGLLEPIRVEQPVLSLAFEPRNEAEGSLLDAALSSFAAEDPSLHIDLSCPDGQRIVSGMGELHLDVVRQRLQREFGVVPRVGRPQVVMLETVKDVVTAEAVMRQGGDSNQFGRALVCVKPLARGGGRNLQWEVVAKYSTVLEDSVRTVAMSQLQFGPHGLPLEDVEITILELESVNGLLTPAGACLAVQQAIRRALEQARYLTLEPFMEVSIVVPEQQLGSVLTVLQMRQAEIQDIVERTVSGSVKEVKALGPLRLLLDFADALRSATQGRAGVSMHFTCYKNRV